MAQSFLLAGCRVLVVEDEYLLADALQTTLQEWGAQVVGPVGDLPGAISRAAGEAFELAIIDLHLRDEVAYPLARTLRQRDIPFVFATGYDRSAVSAEFADVRRWEKPYDEQTLVAELGLLWQSIKASMRSGRGGGGGGVAAREGKA